MTGTPIAMHDGTQITWLGAPGGSGAHPVPEAITVGNPPRQLALVSEVIKSVIG